MIHDYALGASIGDVAPWLNVFVDESGTADLDSTKSGVSRLFIVAAIIVDDQHLAAATEKMNQIANRLASGGEVRSKRIGTKSERRLAFLEAIQEVPFAYVAMVINKDAVDPASGLQFKRSFHKFTQRILEKRLARYGGGLRVHVDEHGSREFMDGFTDYLAKHIGGTLFYGYEQEFVRSEDSRLVQLADLIAGSLAYCHDESKVCDATPQFRELLAKWQIDIAAWPPAGQPVAVNGPDDVTKAPEGLIAATARNRAVRFLDANRDSDDELARAQAATLEMLLFSRFYEPDDNQSVVGAELVHRLEARGFESMSEQTFRSQVIGRLRDNGIVIAGTWQGYRLAMSSDDIRDYLSHSKNVIVPMLSRIGVARRSVLLDTAGRYDILESEENAELRSVVDCLNDTSIAPALGVVGSIDTPDPDEAAR